MLKKSPVYSFLNNNFKEIRKDNANLEIQVESLDKQLKELNSKYEAANEAVKRIENIIKQFEEFNLEFNPELLNLKDTAKKKVLIVGFYGAPNNGDELMLQALLTKLQRADVSITVMLTHNLCYEVLPFKGVNYIHYPRTNMDATIIAQYFDVFVFGGGALIEDGYHQIENAYQFNIAELLLKLAEMAVVNEKRILCLALSSALLLEDRDYIQRLDNIIGQASCFTVRDEYSFETLKKAE